MIQLAEGSKSRQRAESPTLIQLAEQLVLIQLAEGSKSRQPSAPLTQLAKSCKLAKSCEGLAESSHQV